MRNNDIKQLKTLILVIISIMLVSMMFINILEQLRVVYNYWVEYGSVIIVLSSLLLFFLDLALLIKTKEIRVLDIIILLAVVSVVISSAIAEDKGSMISGSSLHAEGIGVCLGYLVILFSTSIISDEKNRKKLYIVITLVAIVNVILGILQAVIHPAFFDKMYEVLYFPSYRAFGTMENPNPYGSFMALFLGLESILFFYSDCIKKYMFHGLLLVLYAYAMILSGTRGAIVGYGVAAMIFSVKLILNAKKNNEVKKSILKLLGVLICLIFSVVLISINSKDTANDVLNRVSSDVETENVDSMGTSRILVWKASIDEVGDRFVFGLGISNLVLEVQLSEYMLTTFDAHNRYLQMYCTQGIVGLSIYLIMIIYIIYKAFGSLKKQENSFENRFSEAILMAVVAYLVADFFCIGMYSLAPYLYLFLGLIIPRKNSKLINHKEK